MQTQYNITVHKKITYKDYTFYVDEYGRKHEPTCNCEVHRKLPESKTDSEIDNVVFKFDINKNNLHMNFNTGESNEIRFYKKIHDQPYGSTNWIDKSRNKKVTHDISFSDDGIWINQYDCIYHYGPSIKIRKGTTIQKESFSDRIIFPVDIGYDDLWICDACGSESSINPETGKVEMIEDFSSGQKFNFKFARNLFKIKDSLIGNILSCIKIIPISTTASDMQIFVNDILNRNYKIINEVDDFLNRNILELSDNSEDYLTVMHNTKKAIYPNSEDELCQTRQKLIKYTYDIYRGKHTTCDIINITKHCGGHYNLYFKGVRHSFKTIPEVKHFLNLPDKYEIVSLKISTGESYNDEKSIEYAELVELSNI